MRLAVIPGDGIGIEVIEQALWVLDAVHPGVDSSQYDLGAARWHLAGSVPTRRSEVVVRGVHVRLHRVEHA